MAADDDQMKAATVESRAYGSVAEAVFSDVGSQEQLSTSRRGSAMLALFMSMVIAAVMVAAAALASTVRPTSAAVYDALPVNRSDVHVLQWLQEIRPPTQDLASSSSPHLRGASAADADLSPWMQHAAGVVSSTDPDHGDGTTAAPLVMSAPEGSGEAGSHREDIRDVPKAPLIAPDDLERLQKSEVKDDDTDDDIFASLPTYAGGEVGKRKSFQSRTDIGTWIAHVFR